MDQFLPQFRPGEEAAIAPQFFMHEGVECVRVLKGGDSRNVPVFRAADVWDHGDFGAALTYADRWPDQYAQFKAGSTQTADGTPLEQAPFLNPSRIADLRALKVFSVEGLAGFDDRYISRLGGNGYHLKEMAQEFLQKKALSSPTAYAQENDALKARLAALEAQLGAKPADPYAALSDNDLRERIKDMNNGKYPVGRPSRDVLVGMLKTLEDAAATEAF